MLLLIIADDARSDTLIAELVMPGVELFDIATVEFTGGPEGLLVVLARLLPPTLSADRL